MRAARHPCSSLPPHVLPGLLPASLPRCRRPAAAAAAPAGPRETQLALATLVDAMSAEAASLHRQLGRLVLAGGGGARAGDDGGSMAGTAGAACEPLGLARGLRADVRPAGAGVGA